MSKLQFALNASLCIGCGACVRDCPVHVFALDEKKRPFVQPGTEDFCFHCQHCLAVCPKGALSIFGKDPAASERTADLPLPSGEQMENLLRVRRSIRQYQRKNVDRALLDQLLHTLANVPTGCNARGLTFTVVDDLTVMDQLREKIVAAILKAGESDQRLPDHLMQPALAYRKTRQDSFFRGAPHLLLISAGPKSATPYEDIIAALAYFDLLAGSHGLGTCWCGYLKMITDVVPAVKQVIGIPAETPFYAMLFGYPAVRYARLVQRAPAAVIRRFGV